MLKTDSPKTSGTFLLHVIWLMGARVWIIACHLFLTVLVARRLGAADWGILAALSVLVSTAAQFGSFGLTSSSAFFVARDRKNLSSVSCNMLLFTLLTGSLLSAGLIFAAHVKSDLFGNLPLDLTAITLLSLPFQLLLMLNQSILLGAKRIGRFNSLDLASPAFLVFNAVVAIWILEKGVATIVVLNAVSVLLLGLSSFYLIQRTRAEEAASGKFQPDIKLFKQMTAYGFKFYIILLVSFIIIRADVLIVNIYRDAAETGNYALASQIASLLLLLPAVINTLLFQRVAESADGRSVEITCLAARRTAFVMLIICLLAIPVSFALPLVYGATFIGATKIFLILLPGVYLLGLELVMVQYFAGTDLPYQIPVFWLTVLLINLTVNFIFVPKFGAAAAAAASSCSYLLIFLLVTVYFRRKTGRSLREIFILTPEELGEFLSRKILTGIFR